PAQESCGHGSWRGGPGRPLAALSAAALRWSGAAGGHRPRHRHRSHAAAVRRAHGRPRPQVGRRDPRPAPGSQPRARQDHHHGDARPARRGSRTPHRLSGEGQSRGGAGAMKYLPLIWSNLKRRKARTILTLLAILVGFLLYGYLAAIRQSFSMGVDVSGADRLMVLNKITIIMPLPKSYKDRLAAIPGVEKVTHLNWFGAIYQDPKNQFGQMAVEPETFLDLYPEYRLPEA